MFKYPSACSRMRFSIFQGTEFLYKPEGDTDRVAFFMEQKKGKPTDVDLPLKNA